MLIVNHALASPDLIARVCQQAHKDHCDPSFSKLLLDPLEMYQRPEYDQAFTPPRDEMGTLYDCTVTVCYSTIGYIATYGVAVDGSLHLWMD